VEIRVATRSASSRGSRCCRVVRPDAPHFFDTSWCSVRGKNEAGNCGRDIVVSERYPRVEARDGATV